MMYAGDAAWPLLMEKLISVLVAYAQQQVEAGADVIQIFDSWVGALSVTDYREYCLNPTTELVQRIKALGVPVIYFGVDTASLLPAMRETTADVLGLDWRTPLDEGWNAVGSDHLVCTRECPRSARARSACARSRTTGAHLQSRPWNCSRNTRGQCDSGGGVGETVWCSQDAAGTP
jgi:uroporphyrinogen decarboxylase